MVTLKKITLLLIITLFFSINSYSQSKVKDPHKRRQTEAMVFKHWSKNHFRPKWYYWLFHNRYRKGADKRYIWQLTPTIATSVYQNDLVEKQKDSVSKVHEVHFYRDADRMVNIKYDFLYKDEFSDVYGKISKLEIESDLISLKKHYPDFKVNFEHSLIMNNFRERQKNIKDSYRPSAEKNEEYADLLKELEEYYTKLVAIKKRAKIALKYHKYVNNPQYEIIN